MKQSIILAFLLLCFASCSDDTNEGFLGEWEGSIVTINTEGNPIVSATTGTIINSNGRRNCQLDIAGTVHEFLASESGNILSYKDEPITNISDSLRQTYITGEAKLVNDTLITFDHRVYTKEGTAVVSIVDYQFEMSPKE